MNEELNREERDLLAAVDAVARGDERPAPAPLAREVAELLALLPYELEPVTPRPELWARIRARLAGSTVVRFPERAAAPAPPAVPTYRHRAAGRGLTAMAAVLALCLVGLGYLLATVRHQETTIAELTRALSATDTRLAEMTQARRQLDMITRVAQHVYPVRSTLPVAGRERSASGKVFVCGKHQQWYLNIQGLEPPPPGYEYCLWFETEDGKVPGGAVEVHDGVAELSAGTMPEGTKGFAVTLEEENSHPEEPRGAVLLRAEEEISL